MNRWMRWAAGSLLVLLAAVAVLLTLVLDREPLVAERASFSVADIAHAIALARQHDPRRAPVGRPMQISLNERDLDLLAHQAARRLQGLRVGLDLLPGQARLQASLPWQWGPASGWLNLQARLVQTPQLPALTHWQLGGMPLPSAWAWPLLKAALQRQGGVPEPALLAEVVQQVRFADTRMDIAYTWQSDTTQRLLAALTPPEEQERLRAYTQQLVELTRRGQGHTVALPALLGPLFELAQQRSLQHDAAQENRAVVLTLAAYVTGRNLASVVPAARQWPQPRRLQVLLAGREDFPQHFLVSALLAMEGTSPLTRAIGLAKEVQDTQGGSGFSFTDMAANRAGQRFGELALNQPAQLQQRLAQGVSERALLPRVDDLPEFLGKAEFEAFYGHVGSPPYRRVLAEIEQRLDALPLYR